MVDILGTILGCHTWWCGRHQTPENGIPLPSSQTWLCQKHGWRSVMHRRAVRWSNRRAVRWSNWVPRKSVQQAPFDSPGTCQRNQVPSLRDNSAKEIRRLHDVLQQHLRALKAMKKEPSSPFITSLIEMKLDNNTRFEWQKHSQASDDVTDYNDLLKFLNLRAQAAESAMSGSRRHGNNRKGQTPNLPGREFSPFTHAQDPS